MNKNIYVVHDGLIIDENSVFNFNKTITSNKFIEVLPNYDYTFIPDEVPIESLIKLNKIQSNDIYEKYKVMSNITGNLICCKDKSKINKKQNKITKETYDEYINFINSYDISKDKWIYNIIDGYAEIDKILYQDEQIIIIPSYTYDGLIKEKIHILVICKDKMLRTIRDLESSHIELLEHVKTKGLEIICEKYLIEPEFLNIYFHYAPSTYQLHIHFTNLNNKDVRNSVDCAHHIDNVIFNLKLNSNYYKLIDMVKRV